MSKRTILINEPDHLLKKPKMGNTEIRDINLMQEIGITITSSANGTMIVTGPNGEPLQESTESHSSETRIEENKLKIRGKNHLRNLFTRTRVS